MWLLCALVSSQTHTSQVNERVVITPGLTNEQSRQLPGGQKPHVYYTSLESIDGLKTVWGQWKRKTSALILFSQRFGWKMYFHYQHVCWWCCAGSLCWAGSQAGRLLIPCCELGLVTERMRSRKYVARFSFLCRVVGLSLSITAWSWDTGREVGGESCWKKRIKMSPGCLSLKVVLACVTGRRPRMHWKDYACYLVW